MNVDGRGHRRIGDIPRGITGARMRGLLRRALLLVLLVLATGPGHAGVLDRAALSRIFPDPFFVGEKDASLPVWPLFQRAPQNELVGYLFESIDLAPLPGFSGTPPNLLVALGKDGEFLDARIVSHHEPVFLEGLVEAPLFAFARQYKGSR